VARAISLIENRDPLAGEIVRVLYPHTGRAMRVGITGPPGVGKSSLISALVHACRTACLTVGVISVDPSSPFTQGALLGDRIRLADHFLDRDVFIRSMGTRGHLGGVAESTLQASLVLDAAGKQAVFVETVGVGQSEIEIASITDTVVLALMPGSGDSVQALKAGIMEIPDVIVVNKKEHPESEKMVDEIRMILHLSAPRGEWAPPVIATSAVTGEGIGELWDGIMAHRDFLLKSGGLEERRASQMEKEVFSLAADQMKDRLLLRARSDPRLAGIMDRVRSRELDPLSAVDAVLNEVFALG
jgi:LAO/AO transport system kinase